MSPAIRAAYDAEYTRFYDRPVPGSDVEIMSYRRRGRHRRRTPMDDPAPCRSGGGGAAPTRTQAVRDTVTGRGRRLGGLRPRGLAPGARIAGPAIIAEDETSTLVGPGWQRGIDGLGYIELMRETA